MHESTLFAIKKKGVALWLPAKWALMRWAKQMPKVWGRFICRRKSK